MHARVYGQAAVVGATVGVLGLGRLVDLGLRLRAGEVGGGAG